MPPAARVTDMHVCPMVTGIVPHVGGPILPPGCPTAGRGSDPQGERQFITGEAGTTAFGATLGVQLPWTRSLWSSIRLR
jgi:hypothetical protein